MDSKKSLYKSIPFWIMVLFLFYSALGFFAVPYFIKKGLTQIVSNNYHSEISIKKVSFNPYRLTTNLESINLTDKDTQLWFSADNILINFSLIKTLFNKTHISEITFDKPDYHLLLNNIDGQPTLMYPQIKSAENENSEPIKLDIGQININHGSVSYLDQTSDKIINLSFKKIGFKNIDFSTDDKYSQFDLNLVTEYDENIALSGQFNLPKLSVSGKWHLRHFTTQTLFRLMADKDKQFYGFHNDTGYIDGNGTFEINSKVQELPDLTIESLSLNDFKTKTTTSDQPQINISKLLISNAGLDLNNKKLTIHSISLDNSSFDSSFDTNNQLIWSVLTNNHAESSDNNTTAWQYTIDTIKGSQNTFKLNKAGLNLNNSLLVTSTEVTNLTNTANQDTTIKLAIVPDETGTIEINSVLQITPLTLETRINAELIKLNSLQAWIPNEIEITIDDGTLSLQQKTKFTNNNFQSSGWIKLNRINLIDKNKDTLLKVNALELAENTIDFTTKTITLNHIKLDKAEGNLSISSENELNINNITTSTDTDTEKNDWIININHIDLIDLQTNFIDHSVQPNYHSNITKINGSIKALSSVNTSKADINLQGVLDTYGTFDIKGKINPLSEKAYTDVAISIQNIDLQNFSTYSAKFIGFPINRGKADFELNYKLNQNLLKGLNDFKFKQFQLGDKIQSEAAINLPLKLAISLLTDNNGIMPINLPVSGRIDDPEFSYGGLVFKAFFKLITGIVASPFKILGKLIPNGDDLDMSSIQFIAGTDTLALGEGKKLKGMQSILQKRTALNLELASNINTIEDSKSLKVNLLLSAMNMDTVPDFTVIDSLESIKKTYIEIFDNNKWSSIEADSTIENVLNPNQLSEKAWKEMLESFNQEAKIQLDFLAKSRTQKIQQLLIETYKISETRIFLKPPESSEQIPPQVKFGIAH